MVRSSYKLLFCTILQAYEKGAEEKDNVAEPRVYDFSVWQSR
jgi:hypothetical protein